MKDRDLMDTTVIGYMLATVKDLGVHVLDIKAWLATINGKLDTKASKDDIADLRVSLQNKADKDDVTGVRIELEKKASKPELRRAIEKHSKSQTAHGYIAGIRSKQWIAILGLITAITMLAGTVFAFWK